MAEIQTAEKVIINADFDRNLLALPEGHFIEENTFHFRNQVVLDENGNAKLDDDGKEVKEKPASVRVVFPVPTAESIAVLMGDETIAKYIVALVSADIVNNVKEQVVGLQEQGLTATQDRIDLSQLDLAVVANNFFASSSTRGISEEEETAGLQIIANWLGDKGLEAKKVEGICAIFKRKGGNIRENKVLLSQFDGILAKVLAETKLAELAPKWSSAVAASLKKHLEAKPANLLDGLVL